MIIAYEPFKSRKKVKRIIGQSKWFRACVKSLSREFAAITDMTKKNTKFGWLEIQSPVLNTIVNIIKENVTFKFPNTNEHFILRTDAATPVSDPLSNNLMV